MIPDSTFPRRDFLKGAGAGLLVVSFGLPSSTGSASAARAEAAAWPAVIPTNQVNSFLAVAQDGSVTAFNGHVDLGTGVRTALGQMVAEELEVPFEQVALVLGDTDKTPDLGITVASNTIASASIPLRQAAAQARQFLLGLASKRLGVPVTQLVVNNGIVSVVGDSSKSASYGDLIGGQHFNLVLDPKVPLKSPNSYTIVGKSLPRLDVRDKVTGAFTYVHDVSLPGMLHGRVIRPPIVGTGTSTVGAKLVRVDGFSQQVPGLVKVVVKGNFVGVVATQEWQAIQAAQALKVTWAKSEQLPPMSDLYTALRAEPHTDKVLVNIGNAEHALAGAAKSIRRTFSWPYQTHGSIGPSAAVADVSAGQATVWSGTQGPAALRADLAKLLGMPVEQIRVLRHEAAGCYGRNCADDASADAALLSQAVGRPVRVQLMRQDEHGWDPKGTAMVIDVAAGLDGHGTIVAWDFATGWYSGVADTLTLMLVGIPPVVGVGQGLMSAPHLYNLPNYRVVIHEAAPTLLRSAWMRTVAAGPNTFANESMMDDLAAAIGADPVEFRLRYLSDPRAIDVVKAVAKQAGWTPRPSPKKSSPGSSVATGRGIAFARYTHNKSGPNGEPYLVGGAWVAWVAEVEVDKRTGQVRVTKVVTGQDNGLTINPDGIRLQLEGNAIQMTSRVLKEEITFGPSGVTSLDWQSYPILTFPEVPEVQVVHIDRPDEPPLGAGEPGSVAGAGAIGNAIFDATGVRLQAVPFTPERVKAALQA